MPSARKYVGMLETEAKIHAGFDGFAVRVTYRDGAEYVCTRDYRPGRVNFRISDGRVLSAAVG